jgi:N-acetylglucosamine-6-phosphate deacetylase
MKKILLKNVAAVLPERTVANVSILIGDGLIERISAENEVFPADETFDLAGAKVFPGFIDIHNHGAVGFDVNDCGVEELLQISEFLAAEGVTAWLPTLVPDSFENYRKTITAVGELMRVQKARPAAQALGVHYEGVFANERMCGALRPEFFQSFTNGDEISALPTLETGIHLTTLAPEVENGIALIRELSRRNWIVSIGHTRAAAETLDAAFENGARHLTHFFNAMTGLHHREKGVVGWALTNESATFDIIADGIHVDPEMLRFAVRSKGTDKVSLISDSVLPTGLGDGEFKIWGEKISVENGRTNNEKGSIAGSVITMHDAVSLFLSLGFTESETANMAALNPARLLGIDNTHGSLEQGKRADLVVLDGDGMVKMTFINGIPTGA